MSGAGLASASLDELREIADLAGVGYHGLDEEGLREKLVLEGVPSE